MLAEQN